MKNVGFVDDFRGVSMYQNGEGEPEFYEYEKEVDEPEYQKRRIYSDEVPMADEETIRHFSFFKDAKTLLERILAFDLKYDLVYPKTPFFDLTNDRSNHATCNN